MKLSGLINPELVLLHMPGKSKDEVLDELIRELYRGAAKISLPEETVRSTVTARENLRGTLLPTGLWIPHARLQDFDGFLLVFGVPETPLLPNRGDTLTHMTVLLLTSPSASTQYLNTLAALAKISQGPLFPKLCAAESPAAFIKIIEDADVDVAHELTVASIMTTAVKTLHPDSTVREAIDMFYKDNVGYIPVLDDDGHFVGELTMTDLFAMCIPAYALKMQNLKFLKLFEPLEDLLRNENTLRVGDVMQKPSIVLDADSPVVEAVLKSVRHRRRHLPVVKKDTHLLGVVGYMDILKKVLRA